MRYLSFIATIVFLPLCAFSQMSPTGPTNAPGTNSTRPRQYEGCLQQSNGKLILIETDGKHYNLVSSTLSLNKYAGEAVSITAIRIDPGDPSSNERSAMIGGPQNAPATLDVSEISQTGGQCSQQH